MVGQCTILVHITERRFFHTFKLWVKKSHLAFLSELNWERWQLLFGDHVA